MSQQLTAFEKYLLRLPEEEAVMHIIDCLKNGEPDNQAWQFMEEFNGPDWKVKPGHLPFLIYKNLISLQRKGGKNV